MESQLAATVVIPTHLRPDMLHRAVRSVLAQTVQPAEVIVVDDACDPATRTLVHDVGKDAAVSMRYVENTRCIGVSASRNRGADVASCDVLAFLDDDDCWAPRYLARATSRLGESGADAVVTWRTDGAEGSLRAYRNPGEGLTVRQTVASNPGVVGSNIVVRRMAFDALGGFDESLPVSNDIDFFVRFLDAGRRYAVVDTPLVLVGNAPGPRLIDADQRRISGMTRYFAKHRAAMSRMQRLDYRRRILRARLRMRRDLAAVRWRRILYTLGVLALSKPEGRKDVQRVLALLRNT